MNPKRRSFLSREWAIHLTLVAGMLLAWIPLLGRTLPVNDDFDFFDLLRDEGLRGYLRIYGSWRIIGQYPPIWVFLKNPAYHPLLVLATHGTVVILFFHLCRSLFGGIRLPLGAALAFAMFPFGYEAFTWIITYNYIVPMVFFAANLLLLVHHDRFERFFPLLFGLSAWLALCAVLGNECVFFATAFSGLFALTGSASASERGAPSRCQYGLALAPLVGCLAWIGLYYAIPHLFIAKHVVKLHLLSVIGVYLRQYSLLDVFIPWFSPVTRHFLFASWSLATFAGILACAALFFPGLRRLSQPDAAPGGALPNRWRTLAAILAVLAGGSLIYVLAAGFTLDARKKYPLLVFMLLLVCWVWRAGVRRRISGRGFFAAASILSVIAAMTTWLVVGIWKYEARRYNELIDFLVEHRVSGPVRIVLHPDLLAAWPQERRSLEYYFDQDVIVNQGLIYRKAGLIRNTEDETAPKVEYDPVAARWAWTGPTPP